MQATPDRADIMKITDRRDSFCGKMSACNNLMQYGIPYSLTALHTVSPSSEAFGKDLAWFAAVCRIVNGFKNLRIGAIGARPAAFNTVRYSEKLLELNGISVETLDLSEVFGRIDRMKDTDDAAQSKLAAIKSYVSTSGIPDAALMKMAKLGAVIDGWMKETYCTISAIQCWTSHRRILRRRALHRHEHDEREPLLQRLRNRRRRRPQHVRASPSPSETPSALLDWNNNYGDDPDKAVCFHCSNLPKHFFADVNMDFQEIIAGTVGKENTFGTCVGRVKAGAMSYRALLHRRLQRQNPRLRRRRRIHQRSARNLRRRRRSPHSEAAKASALTSASRASSTT